MNRYDLMVIMHEIDFRFTHYKDAEFEKKEKYEISDFFSYLPSNILVFILRMFKIMGNVLYKVLKRFNFTIAKKEKRYELEQKT